MSNIVKAFLNDFFIYFLEAIKLFRFGHSMFRIAQDGSLKPWERPRYRFGIFIAK